MPSLSLAEIANALGISDFAFKCDDHLTRLILEEIKLREQQYKMLAQRSSPSEICHCDEGEFCSWHARSVYEKQKAKIKKLEARLAKKGKV